MSSNLPKLSVALVRLQLLVAIAYSALGLAGALLAIPPGYASPVFPAAGFGLVAVVRGGFRLLPGIWLGSCGVNLWIANSQSNLTANTVSVAVLIGVGAALQAGLSSVLIRRCLSDAWSRLDNDYDIIRFLVLAGPIGCLVSATWGNTVLALLHVLPVNQLGFSWWNWWIGDTIGVLLFAPMTLALMQRQDSVWQIRLIQVVVPTLVIAACLTVVFIYVGNSELHKGEQRIKEFGEMFADQIRARISTNEAILSSLNSFIHVSPQLTLREFSDFTRKSREDHPEIQSLSWNPIVSDAERAQIESEMSREFEIPDFHLTQHGSTGKIQPSLLPSEYVVVRYIDPLPENRQLLGYDLSSDPSWQTAVKSVVQTGNRVATSPVRVRQDDGFHAGVLLLQPVYRHSQRPGGLETLYGLVGGVFRADRMLPTDSVRQLPAGLGFLLEDPLAEPENRVLARSAPGSDGDQSGFIWSTALTVGDRSWQLTVYPTADYLTSQRSLFAWMVLACGLLLTSALQAFLLAITGRSSVIQCKLILQTQRLQKQEEFLRLSEQAGGIGTWEADLVNNVQTWSQKCTDLIGLPAVHEPKWEDFLAIVHAEDRQRVIEATQLHIEQGLPYDVEYRVISANGEIRWMRSAGQVERNQQGEPIRMRGIVQDIHDSVMAGIELSKSEAQFRNLFENMTSGFALHEIVTDERGIPIDYIFLAANKAYEKITGFFVRSTIGKKVTEIYPKIVDDGVDWIAEYGQVALFGKVWQVENYAEGLQRWFRITAYQPAPRQFAIIVDDITASKLAGEKLRLAASVFSNTHDGIIITDHKGLIVDANPAFTRITGFSRDEVLGRNPSILKSGRQDSEFYQGMWNQLLAQGGWSGEIWNRKKDGTIYPEWLTLSAVADDNDGSIRYYIGTFADISLLKSRERELQRLANYDSLTGVPNRTLLLDRMEQAIAHSHRYQSQFGVCYLDLDGFKPINDTFGHDFGDQLLIEMTLRIKSILRESDTLARLGGDEFVLLLLDMEKTEECLTMMERILTVVYKPLPLDGRQVTLTASIGLTIYPLDNSDPDALLRHADQAMYQAKQAGKNCFHIYDPELDQRLQWRQAYLKRVEYGLGQDEFILYYQPKINLQSGAVIGAEALIRWQHPERGLLHPGEFLPIIENSELEIKIGEWVIETALNQVQQWRFQGLDLEISVNISGKHLLQSSFVEGLQQRLSRYADLPEHCLQIEVLETVALEDLGKATGIIEACQKLGVSFALDDFGTGYSSLTYLRYLPAETLKIDQSFVRDMLDDEGDHAIVQAIIALSATFRRQTVAEGVETDAHLQSLKILGCQIAQGYGIARPMPASAFAAWCKPRIPGIRGDLPVG